MNKRTKELTPLIETFFEQVATSRSSSERNSLALREENVPNAATLSTLCDSYSFAEQVHVQCNHIQSG